MDPYQPPPPPPPYYQQPPPPPYHPPPWRRDPNSGIRTAGTVAIWVWLVLTLGPILLIIVCLGLCGFGTLVGGSHPSPTAS